MTELYEGKIRLEFDKRRHSYTVFDKENERDGLQVANVTSILNVINKPALLGWAVKKCGEYVDTWLPVCKGLTQDEKDSLITNMKRAHRDFSQKACDIGTEVHAYAECYGRGENPTWPSEERVKNGCMAFRDWWEDNHIEPIFIEKKIYSRTYQYAGTVDLVANVNGVLSVVDYKTSTGIYDEYLLQLGAYFQALKEETGLPIEQGLCVRFDKLTGELDVKKYTLENLHTASNTFLCAKGIYDWQKQLKRK